MFGVTVLALSEWLSETTRGMVGEGGVVGPGGLLSPPGASAHAGHVLLWVAAAVVLVPPLINISAWALWILISIVIGLSRFVYSIFVLFHVIADVWALSAMKSAYTIYRFLASLVRRSSNSTRQRLLHARGLEEYMKLAARVDEEEGLDAWREDESDLPQADILRSTIAKLDESLKAHDVQKLQFTLLNGLLKRNHLGIDERNLHLHALSGTKLLVEEYDRKVVECIQFISECEELSRDDKVSFFKKARRALGQTALMLSGGGAIAMYHAGVVRALIKAGLFKYIRVISGTSGGSIIAGMLAMYGEKELMERVLVKQVSTDFKFTGEMRRRNIRWFPPILDQIKHFMKNGVLIDNHDFQQTCEFYYGDTTFQEGYERSRKHVCISVAASTLGVNNPGGPRRLLLNHITTPNVLIRSAVAASCSLPGIMKPNYLLMKDETGKIVEVEADGVQYVDGSLQADLPFRRISTLFSVSNFIVSQVNFHVVPFLHKPHSPAESSLYWRAFRFFDMDIRHRVTSLAELGLLPRVFGQDLSGVFKQRYHGNITIVPKFRMSEMIGLKAFMNPTEAEMKHYLINGERSVWPMVGHIRHNTAVERALADCFSKLRRATYMASVAAATQQANGHGHGNGSSNNLAGGAVGTTPRTLPPLAPPAGSRTPRRYHLEDAVMPPPGSLDPIVTGGLGLARQDSRRFDDDSDMLGAGTPSAAAAAAAAADGGRLLRGSCNSPGGGAQAAALQRQKARVKELEAENEALQGQVAKLAAALQELLANTEQGLYHHNPDSILQDDDALSAILSQSRTPSYQSRADSLGSVKPTVSCSSASPPPPGPVLAPRPIQRDTTTISSRSSSRPPSPSPSGSRPPSPSPRAASPLPPR